MPGTTRLLEFFNVGDALLLVDTPGYGGWRHRKLTQKLANRASAFAILFRYLALRKGSNLKRVYWLMEASATSPVAIQPRDEELLKFLMREQIPFSIVLTKIDRHWRHCAEQQRTALVVGKDGIPQPGHAPVRHGSVRSPAEGLRRNMEDIFSFLGCRTVPLIGVSANRQHPSRSRNLEALQHDIMHYCAQDLPLTQELTYRNIHDLSYAPPTPELIHLIQNRYPIESFVVPEDNNVSLAQMVQEHEEAKLELVEKRGVRLSARDIAELDFSSLKSALQTQFIDYEHSERVDNAASSTSPMVANPHESPLSFTVESPRVCPVQGRDSEAEKNSISPPDSLRFIPCSCVTSSHAPQRPRYSARPLLRRADRDEDNRLASVMSDLLDAQDGRDAPATEPLVMSITLKSPDADEVENGASRPKMQAVPSMSPGSVKGTSPYTTLPLLPPGLKMSESYVMAIDGTPIPRSMVPSSVEDLALRKEDELPAFATKSAAGAYEEILLLDKDNAPSAEFFLQSDSHARLCEAEREKLLECRQLRTKSAARRQEEQFMAKYLLRERKERSISMQAEGYMCPWLADHKTRAVVKGASGAYSPGKSGAVLRQLKEKGFGGRSFSARTMKNRGRATKKTGFWAT